MKEFYLAMLYTLLSKWEGQNYDIPKDIMELITELQNKLEALPVNQEIEALADSVCEEAWHDLSMSAERYYRA